MPAKDPMWTIVAITIYFAAMLAIGYAAFRRTKDKDDYMLGGRQLHPAVAALSAGAADMSGWLLMGLPGALYATGLIEAWIAIGLTIGVWFNWKFTAPRLRTFTERANNSITLPSFFGNRLEDGSKTLRIVAGVIILVFFTFYVSSGMTAAGTFFQSTFGMDPIWGLIIVGAITLIYTFFGGFLGASWTDTVQGLLMLAALVTVPIMAVFAMGGWSEVASQLHLVDAANAAAGDATNHLSFFGAGTTTAMVLGIISSLAWGLGYFGQPHIIVRFMALRSAKDAVNGRRIGISWMVVISLGAVFAGLIGAAYFHQKDMPLANQETVFLALAQELFPPLLAGFVLAAVLAAVMSTLSSQLVVSSSALVEDLMGSRNKKLEKSSELVVSRMGVLIIAVIGAILSFTMQKLVMAMVAFAWAGFGASFGPTVILSLYWKKLTRTGALAGMIAGAVTVLIWGNVPILSGTLYEIVPGFLLNLIVAVVVSQFTKPVSAAALTAFDEAVAASKSGASVAPDADPEEKVLVNN